MATTTTTNLGLTLAVPGSGEPFDTDMVNDNFEAIDADSGAKAAADNALDARLDAVEPFLLPTFGTPATGRHGLTPSGSTADRDTYWGSPAAGQPRIDLANRGARWYNEEKGWTERYYCLYNEAGTGLTGDTPVADVAGWRPDHDNGRVLLYQSGAAGVSGAGTATKKGAKIEFAGATTVTLDGIFTTDFSKYEVEWTVASGSADASMTMQLRVAAVTNSAASYAYTFYEASAGASGVTALGSQTSATIGRCASVGAQGVLTFCDPMNAARRTRGRLHTYDDTGFSRMGGWRHDVNAAFDGFLITFSGGATETGEFRVYGLAN